MKRKYFISIFLTGLFVSCNNTVPSSYEIHYNKELNDSIVFVNYNVSYDSSNNFYMNYESFISQLKENDYENVYEYHCSHLASSDSVDYTKYRRREFYSNNNPENADYYQSGSSQKDPNGNSSLKPTNSNIQPARPYNSGKIK